MKILSVPLLTHDTSICILEDGKITSYKMEERFSRKKHDLKLDKIIDKLIEEKNTKFDKIIFSYSFLEEYLYPLDKALSKINLLDYGELIVDDENHHLYHAYCGFYNSNFDKAICISADAMGALKYNMINGVTCAESESIYLLDKNNFSQDKSILKHYRLFKKNNEIYKYNSIIEEEEYLNIDNVTKISNILSVGEKYCRISEKYGYDIMDGAGKIMGLGQYKNNKEKLQYPYNNEEWKIKVDCAYDLQQKTQKHILDIIKKYTKNTGVKNVVISGGYGLNCVSNYFYLKNLDDVNLYVDPICFDAGISIGASYYHYLKFSQNLPKIQPLQNVFIGHEEKFYDISNLKTTKVSYEDVVNLLLEKNIIALFQGKSESGQRALGNRSLIFDPRVLDGKNLVNKIKKRENFRPFAGTILLEESHKWFDMHSLIESPYMQYAVNVNGELAEKIPAIVHADNTCRIQTVTKEQNKHFYNLISCFNKKTGVPILLNTSFNLGGEPLVETFKQALYTLNNSMIEYLYLPEIETLIEVKNKKLIYV